MATSRTTGAIRTKIHSNPWSMVPATAYSGLEKSHSRYELPIAASAIRTSAVMAAIAMQRACSARRLDSCARELVVQHFELFGERLQALGLGCGYGLAQ